MTCHAASVVLFMSIERIEILISRESSNIIIWKEIFSVLFSYSIDTSTHCLCLFYTAILIKMLYGIYV